MSEENTTLYVQFTIPAPDSQRVKKLLGAWTKISPLAKQIFLDYIDRKEKEKEGANEFVSK